MVIHEIKCEHALFEDIAVGKKTFLVCRDVRDYDVGDLLAVNEVTKNPKPIHTGRCCLLKVTYILDDPAYCKEGFIIMGFTPCWICAHQPAIVDVYSEV